MRRILSAQSIPGWRHDKYADGGPLCATLSTATAHAAQVYPTKPIRLIVAFATGGLSDITRRPNALSQLSTIAETVPGYEALTWSAILGPKALPKEIRARLNSEIERILRERDLQSVVTDAQRAVRDQVKLTPGYSLAWSGQFEYLERAKKRLAVVVPFTLAIIFVLLYIIFRRVDEALLIMAAVPFALVGGMITAPLLSMLVIPAAYYLLRRGLKS